MKPKVGILLLVCLCVAFLLPLRGNAQETVMLVKHPHRIDVVIDGKPFTTYYFGPEEAKPYLQPLRTARGTIVTRGSPVGNYIPPEHRHDPKRCLPRSTERQGVKSFNMESRSKSGSGSKPMML